MSLNIFGGEASFSLLNPLFDLEIDADSPLDDALNRLIDKEIGQFSNILKDHLFASFTNSHMKHKGNGQELKQFLESPSTRKAWEISQMAGALDDKPIDHEYYKRLQRRSELIIGDTHNSLPVTPNGKKHFKRLQKILQTPKYLLSEKDLELLNEPAGINDKGHRFRSVFDVDQKTLYVAFPYLGGEPLDMMIAGDMGRNNLYKSTAYNFRKNGGHVAEPLYDIYAAHRPTIQKLLQETGATNIYFTGHSLGGGVATLAANDELWDGLNVQITTFGAPAVGDKQFVSSYRPSVDLNRVLHSSDAVPTVGTQFHPTNKVWDIAPPGENYFAYMKKYAKPLKKFDKAFGIAHIDRAEDLIDLDDYLDAVHRGDGIEEAMDDVIDEVWDLKSRQRGAWVSYPRFRAFSNFVREKTIGNIADRMVMMDSFIQYTNGKILNELDNIKSGGLKYIGQESKMVLQKMGMIVIGGPLVIVKNSVVKSTNYTSQLFRRILKNESAFQQISSLPDDYLDRNRLFDFDGNIKYDQVDNLVDLDDIYFKNESIQVAEELDIGRIKRDLVNMGNFQTNIQKGFTSPKKFVPLARRVKETIPNLISDQFKADIKKQIDIVRGKITDLIDTKQYVQLDTIPVKDIDDLGNIVVKTTPLNTKVVIGLQDTVRNVLKNNVENIYDLIKPIKGITGVKKLATSASDLSKPIVKGGVALMKKIIQNSAKFGSTSIKMAKILKKFAAKAMPVIGTALEIGFTSAELAEDVERIEDEKQYIIWNGEVIFKLYNPEEYEQLKMLDIIYKSEALDDTVSFDDFVNTWYGRLSTDENGVVIIDGVRTDDPDFDVTYTTIVTSIRGEDEHYTGESKTLSVLKNIGIGAFNIAMDIASTTTLAIGASAAAGVTIGLIDEIFEQQAIDKKSNGFTRALKFKILNDSYHEIANELIETSGNANKSFEDRLKRQILAYFNYMVGDEKSVGETEPEYTLEELKSAFRVLGIDQDMLDDAVSDIKHIEKLYAHNPDFVVEMAKSIPMSIWTPFINIGGGIHDIMSDSASAFPDLNDALKMIKAGNNIYSSIIENYYSGKKATRENRIDTDRVYTHEVYEQFKAFRDKKNEELGDLNLLLEQELIDEASFIQAQRIIYAKYVINLKLHDVIVNPFGSDFRNDKEVVELLKEMEIERSKTLVGKFNELQDSLGLLLKKHAEQQDGTNLLYEMNENIIKARISAIFKQNGIPEDHQVGASLLRDLLLQHYKNTFPDDFAPPEGIGTTINVDLMINEGLPRAVFDQIMSQGNTVQDMAIKSAIMTEYFYITRIIDVYHDSKSIYKDDPDVIQYYLDNNIEIDFEKRQASVIETAVEGAVETAVNQAIVNTRNELVEKYNTQLTTVVGEMEAEFEQELTNLQAQFDELIAKQNEKHQELLEKAQQQQADKVSRIKRPKEEQEDGLYGGQATDVLEERDQFDLGLADNTLGDDAVGEQKFNPTGKLIPFTLDDGPPRMLFEDGSEREYVGPTNALAGGITHGYWSGAIPNGQHAPINTVDNYFMAYHIENQDDPLIAKLRFISRLTKALNEETISQEKDYIEYELAVYVLDYLGRNQHLFGLEITNQFMRNGLGATINSQLYEEIDSQVLRGQLPSDFNPSLYQDMVIEDEGDIVNPLKRAADFANEIGDDKMATKFRKISVESQDMERVAKEYISLLRTSIGAGGSSGTTIDSQKRLILEKSIEGESIKERYTKELVSVLNKELSSFLE